MGKGSNSTGLRRYNERVVLTTMRSLGRASKSDIAEAVGLTPQAVTRIVDELCSLGLVVRIGKRHGRKGQPSTMYAIAPDGAYSIGVKVGRSDLEMLLMDFGGEIVARLSYPYEVPEPDFVLAQVQSGIEELASRLPEEQSRKLFGAGFAMPWFMGAWTEELGMSEAVANRWNEINFEDEVRQRTSLPVFFENDCSAAAISELIFGRGAELGNFLYVYLGIFVGGGLVLQGRLEAGAHGNAAAVASMPVPVSTLDSARDTTGQTTELLDRASIFVLLRHLQAHGVELRHVGYLHTVLDTARPLIQEWMEDCADALSVALQSAMGLLDLDSVVIDGQLPGYLLAEILEMTDRRLHRRAPSGIFEPHLVQGSHGADAIGLGGALLPFYARFVPDRAVLLKGGVPSRITT
jgi:predicted NBD/HSP70 family sugar kinase